MGGLVKHSVCRANLMFNKQERRLVLMYRTVHPINLKQAEAHFNICNNQESFACSCFNIC